MWARVVGFLVVLVLAGCGHSGFEAEMGTPSPLTVPSAFGRVKAEGPVRNAQITILSEDNEPLVEGVEGDASGCFSVTLPEGLTRFRVAAQGVPDGHSQDVTFYADFEDFDPNRDQMVVTPLTDLASRYRQAHPESGLDQAEGSVRSYLQLHPDLDLRHPHTRIGARLAFHAVSYLQHLEREPELAEEIVSAMTLMSRESQVHASEVSKHEYQPPKVDWDSYVEQLGVSIAVGVGVAATAEYGGAGGPGYRVRGGNHLIAHRWKVAHRQPGPRRLGDHLPPAESPLTAALGSGTGGGSSDRARSDA